MAVNLTDMDIGTRYALQEDFNKGFVGRDRQVVIQTDDPKGYRPVIMDGATTGGKNKVALVDDLSDYVPVDTYNSEKAGFETKSNASSTYATKTELSGYETTTHASSTYATKTELTSGLAGKAASVHTHEIANVNGLQTALDSKQAAGNYAQATHSHTKSQITDFAHTHPSSEITDLNLGDYVPKAGARGTLAGYETQTQSSGATVTIGYSTGDYVGHNADGQTALTVNVDGANLADIGTAGGIKVLFIYNATAATTLTVQGVNGITQIDWEGEEAPSLSGKGIMRLVFQLHDITASISIKQWG